MVNLICRTRPMAAKLGKRQPGNPVQHQPKPEAACHAANCCGKKNEKRLCVHNLAPNTLPQTNTDKFTKQASRS